MDLVLDKLCENFVDVIQETFTKKYYIVRISQSKIGHIYLIIRKKRGRLLYEEKEAFHSRIFEIVTSVFNWYCKRHAQLDKKHFLDLKLIKECSGYHFHYLLISRDRYTNEKYWRDLFLSSHPRVFLRLTERDKKVFNFIYPFQTVYCRVNQTVLTVCFDCQNLVVKDCNSQASCFQRYFPDKKSYLGLQEVLQ